MCSRTSAYPLSLLCAELSSVRDCSSSSSPLFICLHIRLLSSPAVLFLCIYFQCDTCGAVEHGGGENWQVSCLHLGTALQVWPGACSVFSYANVGLTLPVSRSLWGCWVNTSKERRQRSANTSCHCPVVPAYARVWEGELSVGIRYRVSKWFGVL